VRGLGLLNIRTIFGETAVRRKMKLRLITHLASPLPGGQGPDERLPLAELSEEILGVTVRKVIIPVAAGPQPGGAGRGRGAQRNPQAARHRLHRRIPGAPAK
jgi:serine kinase of HPr protein (carbohydrate metabolism regulator)